MIICYLGKHIPVLFQLRIVSARRNQDTWESFQIIIHLKLNAFFSEHPHNVINCTICHVHAIKPLPNFQNWFTSSKEIAGVIRSGKRMKKAQKLFSSETESCVRCKTCARHDLVSVTTHDPSFSNYSSVGIFLTLKIEKEENCRWSPGNRVYCTVRYLYWYCCYHSNYY